MKRTSTLRRMLGTGLGAVVLGATVVAMAVPAGAADAPGATGGAAPAPRAPDRRAEAVPGQHQGVTRPIRPLTAEKIAARSRTRPQACDIKLPRAVRTGSTAEQKQCLADHGVTRPIRPLTKEKVAAAQGRGRRPATSSSRTAVTVLTAEQRQCMAEPGHHPPDPAADRRRRSQQIKDAADGLRRPAARTQFGAKATA